MENCSQHTTSIVPKFDAVTFLQNLNEFSSLPTLDLKQLADSSRLATIDPSQYITSEGDEENTSGFIVVSGNIAMTKTSSSGKELIVELLQPGDTFALLLMLAAKKLPSQLSARSIRKSKVLWVPVSSFNHILKSNTTLFKDFVTHLLLCLHSSYNLSRGLAHDRVEVRIASILASLALKAPKASASEGAHTVHFTRQQLADLTGTTSETAIRVTRAMQRDGLINIARPGIIQVLELDALLELATE
jgi:CRP-like cAMP-binding protein